MLENLGDDNFGAYGSRFLQSPPAKTSLLAQTWSFLKPFFTKTRDTVFRGEWITNNQTLIFVSAVVGGTYFYSKVLRFLQSKLDQINKRILYRRAVGDHYSVVKELLTTRDAKIAAGEDLKYVSRVAAQVVARIGHIPKTNVELAASTQLAYRIMRDDNHRETHILRDMPFICSMIREPTMLERQFAAYYQMRDFNITPANYTALNLVTGLEVEEDLALVPVVKE
jgi:hypothetical protein